MVFGQDNNQNNNNFADNGSIFSTPAQNMSMPASQDAPPMKSGAVMKFMDTLMSKFGDEPKPKEDIKKLVKEAEDLFKENEEIFHIMYQFGCNIEVAEGYVEFQYPALDLVGRLTFEKDKEPVLDENAQKIMEHLAVLIQNSNGMDAMINSYEEEEFYPVGDLEKQVLTINNQQYEVMVGTLMNPKGETKKVYYQNGKDVTHLVEKQI